MNQTTSIKLYALGGVFLIVGVIACAIVPESTLINHWNLQGDSVGDQQALISFRSFTVSVAAIIGALWILYSIARKRAEGAFLSSKLFKRIFFTATMAGLVPCFAFFMFSIVATFIPMH